MNRPNVWELAAWRLVAQLALQGLPQWTGSACVKFAACVRDLWELEHRAGDCMHVPHLVQWFVELREYVPIGKVAEYDHLMQIATRFRDRIPPDACPIGPEDDQIRKLAGIVDQNDDGPVVSEEGESR